MLLRQSEFPQEAKAKTALPLALKCGGLRRAKALYGQNRPSVSFMSIVTARG